jgi:hypothetical protein
MHGLTDYITECHWEEVFTLWFVWLDDLYTEVYSQQRLRQRGSAPVFSDSEVMTISLVIDTYFHGDEELGLAFVRQYHLALFPKLLSRSRFNRRRRALIGIIEHLRRLLSDRLIEAGDDWRLIDSAPIPVCTYQRSRKNATLAGPEYYSVMPCRRAKLFGVRLLMTTNLEQVVDQWLLVPAAPRESKMADVLLEDAAALNIIGDNAFRDPTIDYHLQEARQIRLVAPPRAYDKIKWPASLRQDFNRVRRRIESAFSVLSTVFHVQVLGARSLTGIGVRVATRILAYTLSFLTQPALDTLNN